MNNIDSIVVEILGPPEMTMDGDWMVSVRVDEYGQKRETTWFFDTEEEAKNLETGDRRLV